jgi:Ca2+-transporting ATPase
VSRYAPDFTTWAANGGLDLSAKPCDYMTGRAKNTASTLSLSVLVTIEMFNALNAISEDGSLLQVPPWVNPWLLLAMFVSFGLHFVIMYVPVLATIFSIVPLTLNDWLLVLAFSFPVIIVDEALKLVGRVRERAAFHRRMEKEE